MFVRLRHSQPSFSRVPQERMASGTRGASRYAGSEPLMTRLLRPYFLGPILLVALGWAGYEYIPHVWLYINRPVAKVVIEGDLTYASRQGVQQNIAYFAERNFFDVDLVGMRHDLEEMPWIAHAEVRRIWPDQLVVHLEEQLPIARWGDQELLNNQGQVFKPTELKQYENLPQLQGPERARQKIMQQYQILGQILRPLGFSIKRLELRERGSWFLTTGQGMELLLGRDHLIEKIRRFGMIYQQVLKPQSEAIARVDLRYSNGLAVGWRESISGVAGTAAPRKN